MYLRMWRFCVFAVGLVAIASCKSVVEKPLVGSTNSADVLGISGKWIAADVKEAIAVEIKGQESDGWYDFSFTENDQRIVGEFRVGYFADKLIFNVNVASLVSSETTIFELSEPQFLLLGAHFLDDKLVIVSAKMDVFEERFTEYFEGKPRKLTNRCAVSKGENSSKDGSCRVLTSASKVIALTETTDFQRMFIDNYDDVFPMDDFLVLNPEN